MVLLGKASLLGKGGKLPADVQKLLYVFLRQIVRPRMNATRLMMWQPKTDRSQIIQAMGLRLSYSYIHCMHEHTFERWWANSRRTPPLKGCAHAVPLWLTPGAYSLLTIGCATERQNEKIPRERSHNRDEIPPARERSVHPARHALSHAANARPRATSLPTSIHTRLSVPPSPAAERTATHTAPAVRATTGTVALPVRSTFSRTIRLRRKARLWPVELPVAVQHRPAAA